MKWSLFWAAFFGLATVMEIHAYVVNGKLVLLLMIALSSWIVVDEVRNVRRKLRKR